MAGRGGGGGGSSGGGAHGLGPHGGGPHGFGGPHWNPNDVGHGGWGFFDGFWPWDGFAVTEVVVDDGDSTDDVEMT